uniref:Pollen-specific leucine-rich repeat extensin-like protein 1 isoform X22 n=1 Tax=Crassostrea virginica TaxID=6565 RepID=A0A8B8A5W6_CRAVI|nr:pollen-specific leucine-rich repeat extensin-like protein 1 isoform X22 [Crassostrea virginica]
MSKTPLPDYGQLARWTVNDVCTWLMENRFGSYVSQFREHGIDGGRFAALKDVDLSQMRCPLNKRTDLIKCIRGIPNRDINPPTLQKPVSSFTPSRAPPPSRTEDRHNKPIAAPPADEYSDDDDDYEAWGEFDEFGSSDDDLDYENNQNTRINEGDLEPQEDYANYDPDNATDEGSTVTKNGHSITDSLRHALEQRNRVNQSQERPPPDEPAIPPRPARPGQRGGNVPPPQKSSQPPAIPKQGRRGREIPPRPEPEPEEQPAYIETDDPLLNQPDYEVPEELSSPPSSRPPPFVPPPPVEEDQPTYEDPDETDHAPPIVGRRPPQQRPMEPLPQPSDMPEDVYEDPDQNNTPAPPKKSWPPVPKQKETPLARTISEPDQPAPPPPRHGNDRQKNQRPPPPKVATPSEPDSDDSSSNWRPTKKSDYEKPLQGQPSPPPAGKSRQRGLPPKPPEDEPKSGMRSKGRPPMPAPTTDSPKIKHASRDDDGPPPVPSSRSHGNRQPQVPEGRSLPPTPSHHRGPIEPPGINKPQVRDSVIDRPPPPIPGNQEDITQYEWYQNVSRAAADEVLKNFGRNGAYLVRPSTKAGQPYTLQIYNERNVYNLPIRQKNDSKYALGKEKKAEETFKEVVDLVGFFRKHTLILGQGPSGQTRLKHPCPKI